MHSWRMASIPGMKMVPFASKLSPKPSVGAMSGLIQYCIGAMACMSTAVASAGARMPVMVNGRDGGKVVAS